MLAAVAMASAAALALVGCTSGSSTKQSTGIEANTKLSVAQNSAFTSPNSFTSTGNSTYNQNVIYMTSAGFNYYNNTPKLVKNTKFGTYTKVSDNPLTIKYTVNKGVKWTDGTQVGAADALLNWVSNTTQNNSTAKGGINFTSVYAGAGTGASLISKVPTVSNNGRSFTIVYDKPYIDWEIQPTINMSAAATWELAGINSDTGAKAQQDLIKAVQSGDKTVIGKLATAWSTKFDAATMPSNKAVLVSNGPYEITNIVKNQYVTLRARKNYTAGPAVPHLSQITVREIPDQTAQVQGLQNGELNILYGQATSDTVKALKGAKGITSTTTPTSDYEHIDLTMNNGGPFDPKSYGGDKTKALEVRQAFLHIIPRQEIIDRIIKPLQPSAKADNSATFIPGSTGYDQSVANNGSSAYASADVATAKSLLQKAGVKTPVTVKFAYANDNPRREGEFQLLQAAAKSSGLFTVKDAGKPTADFFGASGLGSGKYNYDAVVFAWSYTSLGLTSAQSQFISTGSQNFQGYSNSKVDSDFTSIATSASSAEAIPLLQDVDKQYLADAAALTLFQLPSVTAWTSSVKNVSDAPLVPNVFWNFWQWENTK
jgi:peptide/nickel transport system substrate-binding protein